MTKLLIGLFVASLSFQVFGSSQDSYIQSWYGNLLAEGELIVMRERLKSFNALAARKKILNGVPEVLSNIKKFCPECISEDEFLFIGRLVDESRKYPSLLPFIKKAYNAILKKYRTDNHAFRYYSAQAWFPKKKDIDAYTSSFEPGSAEAIVLEPLLNPGKLTKEQYDKQVLGYYRDILKVLKFFLDNRSDVLFPGLVYELSESVTFPRGTIADEFESLTEKLSREIYGLYRIPSTFSKPNEKRDLAVLKAFWKASVDDAGLVPFVEKGHANFKKCYGHSAPVRSLVLKKGLTLGMYADKNKSSEVAKLCNKLEPAPKSFLFKAAVIGIVGGVSYFAYKKYKSYKDFSVPGSSVDLASSTV